MPLITRRQFVEQTARSAAEIKERYDQRNVLRVNKNITPDLSLNQPTSFDLTT